MKRRPDALGAVLHDPFSIDRPDDLVITLVIGLVQIRCGRRDIRMPGRVLQRLQLRPLFAWLVSMLWCSQCAEAWRSVAAVSRCPGHRRRAQRRQRLP